jgi:hypothetical protein
VFDAKKNNAQIYADKHFRRDALQGLERCAGEIISEMLQLIEEFDPEEAQMKLLMTGTSARRITTRGTFLSPSRVPFLC